MSHSAAGRAATRRTRTPAAVFLATLIALTAAVAGAFVHQSASSPASSFDGAVPGSPDRPSVDAGGVFSEVDGVLPDGVTVFDDGYPGVAQLDQDLLRVVREAATDAADDGITFHLNSGWRSPAYQDQLLRDAVWEYGSESEAARWVASADTSPHVSGDAIDIGPSEAAAWLSTNGAAYGLCQTYANEPWHFELRRDAIDHGCPRMYADPTDDPRMQQ